MKILRAGNLLELTVYRGTCRNCNCEVEFRHMEGEVVRDQRDGDFIRVNCPTCTTWICVAL